MLPWLLTSMLSCLNWLLQCHRWDFTFIAFATFVMLFARAVHVGLLANIANRITRKPQSKVSFQYQVGDVPFASALNWTDYAPWSGHDVVGWIARRHCLCPCHSQHGHRGSSGNSNARLAVDWDMPTETL